MSKATLQFASEWLKANWVFDVHRKDSDLDGARLEAVLRRIEALDVTD